MKARASLSSHPTLWSLSQVFSGAREPVSSPRLEAGSPAFQGGGWLEGVPASGSFGEAP